MKLPKEAKDLTLAVLLSPEFHWKACCEDNSGRPTPIRCVCPMVYAINKVLVCEEDNPA
jgi:hypothetical protein